MGTEIFINNIHGHVRGICIDGMWQLPECIATQEISAPDVVKTSNDNLCCINCKDSMDSIPKYEPSEDFDLVGFVNQYRTMRGLPRNGWQ
jgi:hypothetical protein